MVLITLLASAYARVTPRNEKLAADVSRLCLDVLGRAAPRLAAAFKSSRDMGALVDQVAVVLEAVTASAQIGATGAAPLTGAELRILPYLQTHLTIGEIGERLFVSRNTVSSEVASIYRKLGVSSRNDAVEQATRIGMRGG